MGTAVKDAVQPYLCINYIAETMVLLWSKKWKDWATMTNIITEASTAKTATILSVAEIDATFVVAQFFFGQ